MAEHTLGDASQRNGARREYVQSFTVPGAAEEMARLADLRNQGVIDEAEFQQGMAKALA